jgi:hypothetical protein
MTSPVIQSVQHSGTTLYIIFDRAITVTPASELNGFTFTRDPGAVPVVPVYASVDQNALIATIVALTPGQTLTVTYDNATGTVVDAATGLDDATNFTIEAVAYYVQPLVVSAQTGRGAGNNNKLTITFSEPVGSPTADLIAGFEITVDSVPLDLTGATASLNEDQTQLTITCVNNFSYNDTLGLTYTAADGDLYSWPSGVLADFTLVPLNISNDGWPDSGYPLSIVTQSPVTITAGTAVGTLGVSLNPVDIQLVTKYGPAQVNIGGTFGVTLSNPDGVDVLGSYANIVDGALIAQSFAVAGHVPYAVDAAKDWLNVITTKIGIKLGELRQLDQSIVLNSIAYEQV